MSFSGFPRELPDFLLSLQVSNTLDLLPENKQKHKKMIIEPLTRLFYDLIPVVSSISGTLETKPSKCISSMYQDRRFSSIPLKDYLYLRFREVSHEDDRLGFYFDMGYESYSYGIRIYRQTYPGMEKIRKSALKKTKAFTKELEGCRQIGMIVMGDRYMKDHYPDQEDRAIKDLLNRKKFYIGRDHAISEAVFHPELSQEIATAFFNLKAIYALLKEALYYEN